MSIQSRPAWTAMPSTSPPSTPASTLMASLPSSLIGLKFCAGTEVRCSARSHHRTLLEAGCFPRANKGSRAPRFSFLASCGVMSSTKSKLPRVPRNEYKVCPQFISFPPLFHSNVYTMLMEQLLGHRQVSIPLPGLGLFSQHGYEGGGDPDHLPVDILIALQCDCPIHSVLYTWRYTIHSFRIIGIELREKMDSVIPWTWKYVA